MAIIGNLPNILVNGTTADASQVMADFNFIVNQVNANAFPLSGVPLGVLVSVQAFSVSGTYNPSGTKAIVFGIGAGGAGGGSPATGVGQLGLGSGGNSGAFGQLFIASGLTSQAVSIGAGGVGVSGASGGAGGNTSFGSLLLCPGGAGGAASGPSTPPFVATTSNTVFTVSGTGTLITQGITQVGSPGYALVAGAFGALGGQGAHGLFGGSGGAGASAQGNGSVGSGVGAGGGGALTSPSGAAQTGGNGAPGRLVVLEFA